MVTDGAAVRAWAGKAGRGRGRGKGLVGGATGPEAVAVGATVSAAVLVAVTAREEEGVGGVRGRVCRTLMTLTIPGWRLPGASTWR